MNKKWIRYGLIALVVVAAGVLLLRGKKGGEETGTQLVQQVLQAVQTSAQEGAESTPLIQESENSAPQVVSSPQGSLPSQESVQPQDSAAAQTANTENSSSNTQRTIKENGTYTSKDDVALYVHTFAKLPSNFITKKDAQSLGWTGGGLDEYAKGKSIGGDYFGNYEGKLPKKSGRKYTECDIDTKGKKSRGAKRIVFSNDGLVYYTGDHYETFELLYGEE